VGSARLSSPATLLQPPDLVDIGPTMPPGESPTILELYISPSRRSWFGIPSHIRQRRRVVWPGRWLEALPGSGVPGSADRRSARDRIGTGRPRRRAPTSEPHECLRIRP
jgi:hypothetical protein